jgi:signal recognition particle GTPase
MSWFQRLKAGLQRSSNRLVDGINRVLGRKRIDAATLAELEDALIEADLGPAVAHRLCERLRAQDRGQAGENGEVVRRARRGDRDPRLVAQPPRRARTTVRMSCWWSASTAAARL